MVGATRPAAPPHTHRSCPWLVQKKERKEEAERKPLCSHPPVGQDYTLAQYKPEAFETLAHDQTVDKLVKYFGYPQVCVCVCV